AGAAGQIADAADLTFSSDGRLDLNGKSETIDGLDGGGTVLTTVAGAVTLTVGANNQAVSDYSGSIALGSGTLALTKSGSGKQTLSGTNGYTGATAVNGGTLAINGSVTSNVTVTSPGVLNGGGTITGNVSGSGTFAPG